LPQVTAADLQYPNGDGEISISDDEPEDPFDADYIEDLPKNSGETLDQEHEVTSVLGWTGMVSVMSDQEQEELEEEENDGETREQANEAEGAENLVALHRQLRNQVTEVDQQVKMYQETSDSSTE
jgi:uncharacterized protein YlxW (UPF0749 family)